MSRRCGWMSLAAAAEGTMVLNVFRACVIAMLAASPAAAQNDSRAKPASDVRVTVAIGDTAAPPEWELSVPVSLTLEDGVQVGRLSMRLAYPASALRYVSLKPTDTLTKAGFAVTTSAKASKADSTTSTPARRSKTEHATPPAKDDANEQKEEVAEMSLEFRPVAGAGEKALPSGRVAIVVFKVSVDAQTKTWAMTAKDVQAWGVGASAAELTAAAAPPAKFTVSPPGLPIFGCFFYMH